MLQIWSAESMHVTQLCLLIRKKFNLKGALGRQHLHDNKYSSLGGRLNIHTRFTTEDGALSLQEYSVTGNLKYIHLLHMYASSPTWHVVALCWRAAITTQTHTFVLHKSVVSSTDQPCQVTTGSVSKSSLLCMALHHAPTNLHGHYDTLLCGPLRLVGPAWAFVSNPSIEKGTFSHQCGSDEYYR